MILGTLTRIYQSEELKSTIGLKLSTVFLLLLCFTFKFGLFSRINGIGNKPADRWNLDSLLTTLDEVWVLTPTGPP